MLLRSLGVSGLKTLASLMLSMIWQTTGQQILPVLIIMDCFCVSSSLFPAEYTVINENCPGAEWNIMCRECCEYDQIECICPGQKERVGYTIPCCRNEENECDSCLIHPGVFVAMRCSHQIFGQGIMAETGQGSGEQALLTEAWDCPAFPQELHLPLSWQQQGTWQGSPKAGSITGQKTQQQCCFY